MAGILTYAVGDIHGAYDKLTNLLAHCHKHRAERRFRLVFIGDYVDRGPRSREVVSHLIEAQASAPDQVICLRGNHEEMLVNAAQGNDERLWLDNGGEATLRSYGVADAAQIPREHLDWFGTLPLAISDEMRFFVHAGIIPGVPLQQQPREAMLWIRGPFLNDRGDHGRYIVHGHTPIMSGKPDLRRNRLNIDTGACFGGPLTAAVFDESAIGPIAFITDVGAVVPAPALTALEQA